jgi:hypothetical protein
MVDDTGTDTAGEACPELTDAEFLCWILAQGHPDAPGDACGQIVARRLWAINAARVGATAFAERLTSEVAALDAALASRRVERLLQDPRIARA